MPNQLVENLAVAFREPKKEIVRFGADKRVFVLAERNCRQIVERLAADGVHVSRQ